MPVDQISLHTSVVERPQYHTYSISFLKAFLQNQPVFRACW